jgi:hypothetical protein
MKLHIASVFRSATSAKLLGILLAVAPVNVFGGSIVFSGVASGADGQITTTPTSSTGGGVTFGNCIGDCLLEGTATVGPLSIPWSLTSSPFTYVLTSPSAGTISGAASPFLATDAAGDKLMGSLTLTSFTQDGDGDAVYSGTFTYSVLIEGSGLISTEFGADITGEGFSLTGGAGTVMIGEGSCGTACLTTEVDPTGSATDLVVTPATATPEPGSVGLLAGGLAALGLALRRHERGNRRGGLTRP